MGQFDQMIFSFIDHLKGRVNETVNNHCCTNTFNSHTVFSCLLYSLCYFSFKVFNDDDMTMMMLTMVGE